MIDTDLEGRRVILGLSGGVDSAVAALLLKQRGADVQALHMTNWEDDDGYCTAADDLQDARRICEQLDVPLHHVNFSCEYRDRVFEYFLEEYRSGRTPNPDVLCNREIKFGAFREYAHRLGGDLIATGHYARTRLVGDHCQLLKAADSSKDQSYFLHAVDEQAFAETVFPLGDIQKSDVRQLARDFGLAVHDKKDSTGICFIGERPFREFLSTYLPANPGEMRTAEGRLIGEHHGLMYYTIGQRQGLGVGGRKDAGDDPWFVAGKDLSSNTLIVVQGDNDILFSDRIEVSDIHWINGLSPQLKNGNSVNTQCKIRYRQSDQDCLLRATGDTLELAFSDRQRAVAPGQFAVFYDGDQCLGGGVISRVLGAAAALKAAI